MLDFKKAYAAAKKDPEALIYVLSLFGGYNNFIPTPNGFKCSDTSLSIAPRNNGNGEFICTDFGSSKIPQVPNLEGVDFAHIMFKVLYGQEAQQMDVFKHLNYEHLITNKPSPKTNNGATNKGATKNPTTNNPTTNNPTTTSPNNGAKNNPTSTKESTKKGGSEKTEHRTRHTPASWNDAEGVNLLAYFEQKTGCADVDILTKFGIFPLKNVELERFKNCENLHSFKGGTLRKFKGIPTDPTAKNKYSYFGDGLISTWKYGFEQLPIQPKSTDKLFFVEGEKDVFCGSAHLNAYGIHFVTVGSANGELSEGEANSLKPLFSENNIYALGDNDPKGREKSKEFANKHGFVWIDPKTFYPENCKDLCELWDILLGSTLELNALKPKETAQKMLLYWFKENTAQIPQTPQKPTFYDIPAIIGDRFSISVKNAIRHDFNQYLSEPQSLEQFIKYTEQFPRILLESPPGTGKSILIARLFDELVTKTQKFERIAFFVPTIPLGEQLAKDPAFSHTDILFICGKTAETANEKLPHSKLCAITFDSSAHLPPSFWDKTLLIVDEAHQIGTDYDYRKSPMRAVWGVLGNPLQPAICLSGTAEYLYTTKLCAGYNFQLIKGFPKVTNIINITGKLYNPFEVKRYELVTHIQQNRPKSGTTLMKINSKNNLEIWGKDFENKGLSNSIIYSNDDFGGIRRSLNPDYNSIIEQGTLHAHTDVLTTTCLLEAGVSLKFPIPLVCAMDTAFWAGNMQFSTRPRMYADTNTGKIVNNLVDFWVFFADTETENNTTKGENKTQLFKFHYRKAQQFCKELNSLPLDVRKDQLEKLRTSNTFKEKFVFEKDLNSIDYNSTFEVDVPAIEHFLIGLEIENSTPQQIINRILSRDNRYKFKGFEQVIPTQNPELAEFKKEAFEQKKATKEAFFNLLGSNFTATLEAIALTANGKYKDELLNYLNVPYFRKEQIAQIQAFKDANKDAFEQSDKTQLACQIIECIKLGCTVVEGIEKVSKGKYDPNDFERISIKQLLALAKTSPHLLTRKEKNTLSAHSAVSKVFDNLMYNQTKGRTKPQTLEQLTDKLNETLTPFINKLYTKNKALDFLKVFYVVEGEGNQKDKNGVRFWSYTLTEAHDLGRITAQIIPTK